MFDYQEMQQRQNITMFLLHESKAVFPTVDFYRVSVYFVPRGRIVFIRAGLHAVLEIEMIISAFLNNCLCWTELALPNL